MRLPLHEYHETHGHLSDFAGFEMPLWYEGITAEHLAVRNRVGLFDVSHMGRARIIGTQAADFLDFVTSRNPSSLEPLQGQYSVMCNSKGGVIDDFIVYNLGDNFFMVYNAANRVKDYRWLLSHATSFEVEVHDVSNETVMFALQGPHAVATLQKLTGNDVSGIRRFWIDWVAIGGINALVMRSGYTGEDGFEIIVFDVAVARNVWDTLLKKGADYNIQPCGLGARDSLRLEAGLCLYGNDLTEEITPLEAGLNFVVRFEKDDFIGRKALIQQKKEGIGRTRVGLRMVDPGIPRQGQSIYCEGSKVGFVSSGGFSPILKRGIAMGYVPMNVRNEGTSLQIEVRSKLLNAEIVKMPFYDPTKYGWRRMD